MDSTHEKWQKNIFSKLEENYFLISVSSYICSDPEDMQMKHSGGKKSMTQ